MSGFSLLRQHKVWGALSLITVVISVVGFLAIGLVKRSLQEHLAAYLKLVLNGTAMMVETGFEGLARQAKTIAYNDHVQSDVADFAQALGTGSLDEAAKRSLAEHIAYFTDDPAPLGYVVADATGLPIMSSGVDYSEAIRDVLFPKLRGAGQGEQGVRISLPMFLRPKSPGSQQGERLAFAIVVPLVDLSHVARLNLWLIHDARKLFASVLQPGRSGTTGELYAFDQTGRMISDSRFNAHLYGIGLLSPGEEASMNVVLKDPGVNLVEGGKPRLPRDEMPLTRMAQSAVAGQSGEDFDGYNDYRGVPVVGVWKWLDRYGFGVTHEIDVKEAYFAVDILVIVVGVLVFLLIGATLITGFLSARVVKAEEQQRQSRERLKALQGDIAHVSRVATMGEMATGLAHEINQPLAAIANYAKAALNRLDSQAGDAGPVKQHLSHIESNALRCGEIIRKLRAFVGRREIELGPVAVDKLVCDPLSLVASDLRGLGVNLAIEIPGGLPKVLGDEIQLQQVVLNLVRNSVEAMRRIPGRSHRLAVRARLLPEGHVVVDVADTGSGIESEVRERLFEQFNSSNPQGLGLGLAISRTIIESHGGAIDVTASSPDGTTFSLKLPIAADASLRKPA